MTRSKAMAGASVVLIGFLAAGCATTMSTRKGQEKEGLNTQVSSLETQVTQLTQRLEELARGQQTLTEEVATMKGSSSKPTTNFEPASKPTLTTREAQQALANAGFYQGSIDGKEGPRTKQAIRDFQKANGLTSDGVVGKKTAVALSKHLKQTKKE